MGEMTTSERSGGVSGAVAGVVAAIGGALMAVGALLSFASVEAFGVSQSVGGLDTDDGPVYLGAGLVLAVLGIVILVLRSTVVRRVLGVTGILVAGFMTYAGIVDITSLSDDIPPELLGEVSVSAGIGLYLVLAGAVVALIGSGMALFSREEARVIAPPAPPPPTPPPSLAS